MEWITSINRAIEYIEAHLLENITVDDVAHSVNYSYSNFQRIFYLLTGVTIGEYIRSRRLSAAGEELLSTGAKIIDVAMRFQYDSPESFSKAFSRFHGFPPSDVRKKGVVLRRFYPMEINISIHGGDSMARRLMEEFYWRQTRPEMDAQWSDAQKYEAVIDWARHARGKNPKVFDELIDWLKEDAEWSAARIEENRQILMQGILARFRDQNDQLRRYLLDIKSEGIVNQAVFDALDKFDMELSGISGEPEFAEVVSLMFRDFSVMQDKNVRAKIAGEKSGPAGVSTISFYGYINCLKDCDAQVQWALFMPDTVRRQQRGFQVESFRYVTAPSMRFIGKEAEDAAECKNIFAYLDQMSEYQIDITADICFWHHDGLCIDAGTDHHLWGRFMKPGTPVPPGYQSVDLVHENDGGTGAPYLSQYAYATFTGDPQAMHSEERYDVHGMYDVTRNIILGQGVMIPYPHKYWTAEVFLNGYDAPSTAYMFSTIFDPDTDN